MKTEMSYCRWSSNNFNCDLYVYESFQNEWVIHIADLRRVGVENLPPDPLLSVNKVGPDTWTNLYQEHRKALDALEFEKIELPHAGETFHECSLEDLKARLIELREIGYIFPNYVLETIDDEIKEQE